jgi:hypothetical protein
MGTSSDVEPIVTEPWVTCRHHLRPRGRIAFA